MSLASSIGGTVYPVAFFVPGALPKGSSAPECTRPVNVYLQSHHLHQYSTYSPSMSYLAPSTSSQSKEKIGQGALSGESQLERQRYCMLPYTVYAYQLYE
jgi:hypothetical protein